MVSVEIQEPNLKWQIGIASTDLHQICFSQK